MLASGGHTIGDMSASRGRPGMSPYLRKGVLALEEIREKLLDLIKTIPDDKLQVLLDFANHLYSEYQENEESDDDELLMD
jgi:deoxyribodipyrimidine photolyase